MKTIKNFKDFNEGLRHYGAYGKPETEEARKKRKKDFEEDVLKKHKKEIEENEEE